MTSDFSNSVLTNSGSSLLLNFAGTFSSVCETRRFESVRRTMITI